MAQSQIPTGNAARVILVPNPVSVLASFGYYLAKQAGLASPHVSYRWLDMDNDEDSEVRLCLFGPRLFIKVLMLLERLSGSQRKHMLRRVVEFCKNPTLEHKATLTQLQTKVASLYGPPREILEVCADYWEGVVSSEVDLFKNGLPPFQPNWNGPTEPPLPAETPGIDTLFASRPKYDGILDEEGRGVVVGSTEIPFEQSRVRFLLGRHLTVGVFGPPGVGKTTVVASLLAEMRSLVKTLSVHSGPMWKGFNLRVDSLDLDLGTPTLDKVQRDQGHHGSVQKQPWTLELAAEGMRRLEEKRSEVNILLVDLPGMIDPILELLGCSLDGTILLIPKGDKDLLVMWRKFLDKTLAVKRLSENASYSPEDGRESLVRAYDPRKTVRGHIVGMSRLVRSDNPTIGHLAKALLFGKLPQIVEQRFLEREKLTR